MGILQQYRLLRKHLSANSSGEKELILSGGEIHYLWYFMQGSIMVPSVRFQLRRAWGFCERHAWANLLIETSFRHEFLHGPAILYEDLLRPAVPALRGRGPLKNYRLVMGLREKGPCMMCDMDYGPESKGSASEDLLVRGREVAELNRFANRTRVHWEKMVCGRCLGNEAWPRCRPHLIQDASRGMVKDIACHRAFMDGIMEQIAIYSRSFRWEYRGTVTEKNEAALISAVGWCSGWRPFLSLVGLNK